MPKKTEITGTISLASWKQQGTKYPYLSGWISGDTKGRFPDGHFIFTSVVKKQEGDLIYTLNSVYRIESWLSDEFTKQGMKVVGEIR